MSGILMTKVSTPFIGWAASLLGIVMDAIYNFLSNTFGIKDLGVCIILLTIVIYTCMIPLTIKQQKFSKLSAAMNPEIQKVQNKYKNKKDQASLQKQQEETQAIYKKYGVSPMGGCANMLIQMPFLFGMFYVIRSIPAYVNNVKEVYLPLIKGITATEGWQPIMESIGVAKPILINPEKFDYTQTNTLVDVLYKFQGTTWETLMDKFPHLESTIEATMTEVNSISNFFGINIAEAPLSLITSGFKTGAIALAIAALCIPLLAGLTQYISAQLTTASTSSNQNDQMSQTMKQMNITMPIMSALMCFTMPSGLGIYWIVSAVVRTIQQVFINMYFSKISLDDIVKKNMEKAEKQREKELKAAIPTSTKKVKTTVNDKEVEEKLAARRSKGGKAGSLASKANMVDRLNDKNK